MKIYLTPKAFLKLKYYAQATDGEISGLGRSYQINEEAVLVDEIYCLEQTSSSVGTELDKKAVASFYDKMHRARQDTSKIRAWWHSHGDMRSFFSTTDDETINTGFKCDSYLISIVVNRKMELEGRIDIFKPFRCSLETEVEVYMEDKKLKKEIIEEVKEKLLMKPWFTSQSFSKKNRQKGKKQKTLEELNQELIGNEKGYA